jgi:hypothetical protein
LVWGASQYYQYLEEATKDPSPAESYQPARDARLPPWRFYQQRQPSPYQPNCQQPQGREDSDLCAQWSAVKAVQETNRLTRVALNLATLGFIFAVLGAVVGLFGTVMIWLAWKETRASNVIAHTALEGQLRPWISFLVSNSGKINIVGDEVNFSAKVTFKNIGSSPAIDLTYFATLIFGDEINPEFRKLIDRFRTVNHDWADKNLFPDGTWIRDVEISPLNFPQEPVKITFVVVARYRTPFSDKYCFTARAFDLTREITMSGLTTEVEGPIDLANATSNRMSTRLRERDQFAGYTT